MQTSIWERALSLETSKHAPQVLGQELGDLCGSSQLKPCCEKSEELQEGQRGKEKKQRGCGQDAPALCRRSHICLQQTQLLAWAWTRSICWMTLWLAQHSTMQSSAYLWMIPSAL